ncbi:hypothetical protein TNCT_340311 [Trichonephila clavata]|uniref:Uncharacterized protein n=1 Tax=Trichonephila clavata TaxID=2740835 RepID=A0A8X6HUY5_TRICU|nr:hypothetical protein TNCT_340311 [Trichonephila clavata]
MLPELIDNNTCNAHTRTLYNPHSTESWVTVYSAHRFYCLDWTLTSISSFYKRYFQNCLPTSPHLFGAACGFNECIRMWSPSHYGRCVLDHLNWTFQNRWTVYSGPVSWPPRSPDLSPLIFFFEVP